MKSLLTSVILSITFFSLNAQHSSCGFDHNLDQLRLDETMKSRIYENDNLIKSQLIEMKSHKGSESRTTQYTLPVIVHVMEYQGNQLLTNEEVLAGLDRLNTDFNSGDTSANIEFCPARRSPENIEVLGVNRFNCSDIYCGKYSVNGQVQTWGSETTDLKKMTTWMSQDYINIWVVNQIQGQSGNTLGFSSFPNTVSQDLEGIVMDYNYFNTGVLTHEVGHYLGLYHTFEGTNWGCIDANNCETTGDKVCDTAPHLKEHNCSDADKSNECCEDGCNGIGTDYDTYAYNYMSYSDVACLSKFTPGQVDRMRMHVETFYNSLTYSNGCESECDDIITSFDGPLEVNAQSTYTYTNTTSGNVTSAWYLDQQLISNDNAIDISISGHGLHTLCLFSEGNDCRQDHCETIYVIDELASCNESQIIECDYSLNGGFETSVSLDDNVSYIKDAYHFSQHTPQWDLVCNWYNRVSSPLYCTQGQAGKFMLGINYDNLESIGMVKPLNLEVGKEYTVSLGYSCFSYNNIDVPMKHFTVGLSHTVYKSDEPGNNEEIIKVVSPANEPELYDYVNFRDYETQHTASVTFTYTAEMGKYLYVEGLDDYSRNRLIVDNISVINCDETCSLPFSYKQMSDCMVDFDGSTNDALTCTWDFGDGTLADGLSVSHSYTQPGYYEVCMTRECTEDLQVICETVEIAEWDTTEYLTTELTSKQTNEGSDITYTLCNDSAQTIENANLALQISEEIIITEHDGFDLAGQNLSQSLDIATGCTVFTLSVTSSELCFCESVDIQTTVSYDTDCKSSTVMDDLTFELKDNSITDLEYDVVFDCSVATLTLKNTDPCVEYQWTLGDNEIREGSSVTHDFVSEGEYPITITATHACGTSLTKSHTLDVSCETPLYNCDLPEDVVIFDQPVKISAYLDAIASTSSVPNKTFYVGSSLIIDTPVNFHNCTLYFAQDANLIIEATDNPITFNTTTMTACSERWEGIKLAADANVVMKFGTVIENAKIGIEALKGVTQAFVYRCQFKDNLTAVKFGSCDEEALVAFDEVSIYHSSDDNMSGTVGIEIAESSNFSHIRRSNFRNLQNAIYSNNANIEVKNGCTFDNIGAENIIEGRGSNINSSAIIAVNQSYVNIIEGNQFNCNSGITLNQSTGNIANNTFNVTYEAILGSYDQSGLLQITHNSIVSAERGVDLTSVSHATVYDNTITIDSGTDNEFGAAITLSNDIGGDITANLIEMNTGNSGIAINNQSSVTIQDNTLVNGEDSKTTTSGIKITGGVKHTVGCNTITSFTPNARHTGISVSFSIANNFIQNEFENLDTGLAIEEMSDNQELKCNVFQSGNIGLSINSNIGTQGHNSNQWTQGGWAIADATTTLSNDELSMMQFQVNGSSYPYTPSKIEANGQWFESNTEQENNPCVNCNESRNSFGSNDNDFIEALCKQVTQMDEEDYLENFQLLRLIEVKNLASSDYSCINAFVQSMNERAENKYNAIGDLMSSNESNIVQELKSVNNALIIALEEQNSFDINILTTELKQLQSELMMARSLQMSAASTLNTGVKAKSEIATTWKTLHSHQLDLTTTGEIALTRAQYRDLEMIATSCPTELGQIVYTARDILSRNTRVDYSNYNCDNSIDIPSSENLTRSVDEDVENTKLDISVYPNPTSEYINIKLDGEEDQTISIYASNGKLMHQSIGNDTGLQSIDVQSWTPGMYLVQVSNNSGLTTQKIMVN